MIKELLCAETIQGCEQMLASVEQKLCEFLAGPQWKKTMKPEEVVGGLIL